MLQIQNLRTGKQIRVRSTVNGGRIDPLTRGYRFMGGVPPPFDTLKICTSTHDMKLEIYR